MTLKTSFLTRMRISKEQTLWGKPASNLAFWISRSKETSSKSSQSEIENYADIHNLDMLSRDVFWI